MSECSATRHPVIAPNPLRSLGGSRLARGVHDLRPIVSVLAVLLVAQLAGCVIPPSLSVDNQDAGINSPPAVIAVRTEQEELAELDTVPFVRGEQSTLSIELLDTDLQDTLYVRIFVDYTFDNPSPARSACVASPTGIARRTVSCDTTALCPDTVMHDLQVKVFDRQLLDSGMPAFQAMPEGGLSTGKVFKLDCKAGA